MLICTTERKTKESENQKGRKMSRCEAEACRRLVRAGLDSLWSVEQLLRVVLGLESRQLVVLRAPVEVLDLVERELRVDCAQ